MHLTLFFKGISIGAMMTAALGPLAVLCIRQTLAHGQLVGIVIGLGTAIGDVIYGLITSLFLTFISQFIHTHESLFKILGGIFLILFGCNTFFAKEEKKTPHVNGKSLVSMATSTLLLNLSNPITLISCTAIFAGIGIETEKITTGSLIFLLIGIFMGAMMWNLLLTSLLRIFHGKITHQTLTVINKCFGTLIIIFGVLCLISSIFNIRIL